ncbi:MAG: ABC transporter ATP-binding protein [Candidatus Schekmanbacteria bacterium]|nr:ABC transporter ATP-binding protein [Candidatus Schekmanbacteria bacterium]
MTSRPHTFHRLLRLMWRRSSLYALLLTAFVTACRLYLTWVLKRWCDALVAAGGPALLTGELVLVVSGAAVMVAAIFGSEYWMARAGLDLQRCARNLAVMGFLRSGAAPGTACGQAELLSRVLNDGEVLTAASNQLLRHAVGNGLLVVGCVAMMFVLQPVTTVVLAVSVPAVIVLAVRVGRRARRVADAAQAEIATLSRTANEIARFGGAIRNFGAEAAEGRRFAASNGRYAAHVATYKWWASLLVALTWLFGMLLALAMALGYLWVFQKRASPGALLAFALYGFQAVEPYRALAAIHAEMQRVLAAAARVFAVADLPPLSTLLPAHRLPVANTGLAVTGLFFAYTPQAPVLANIAFAVAPRESVGIVAASGAGKTTLANVLRGLLEPAQGEIRLAGRDYRDLGIPTVRRNVLVVDQEPILFGETLRFNIGFGSPEAPEERVRFAVEALGLGALAAASPCGLDTPLSDFGLELSGGQKQRVCLARAVLREPAVLILDEATSALDTEAESEIFSRLAGWLAERTVIVMSHRWSTVRRFARVLVLADGQVLEDGSPEELAQRPGLLRRLLGDQLGQSA